MNTETTAGTNCAQRASPVTPFQTRRLLRKAFPEVEIPAAIIEKPSNDSCEDLAEFPISALNPVMRRIVEEAAETFEIVPQLPGMAALATLAGAAGKGWIGVGASNKGVTWCNLMVVPAVPKSYGKGVTSVIVEPLIEASEEMTRSFHRKLRPGLEGESLDMEAEIKALTDRLNPYRGLRKGETRPSESEKKTMRERRDALRQRHSEISLLLKSTPTYWIGGTSMAGMVEALARNNEAIFHCSVEAGEPVRIALGKHTKDHAADFDLLLSGYSVERIGNTTISRGDHRLTPCISLLWMVQPFLLRELIANEEALERGLTARMLPFVFEPQRIAEDDGKIRYVTDAAKSDWRKLIRAILEARHRNAEPKEIAWSFDAREIFREFHNESVGLRNGKWRDIEGELGRWRENAIRIGNGIVLADAFAGQGEAETGTAEQAERAVILMRWCARSQLAVFNGLREKKRLDRLEKLLALIGQYGGRITLRDLGLRHGYAAATIQSLAADYPNNLRIIEKRNPEGGRPSIIVASKSAL